MDKIIQKLKNNRNRNYTFSPLKEPNDESYKIIDYSILNAKTNIPLLKKKLSELFQYYDHIQQNKNKIPYDITTRIIIPTDLELKNLEELYKRYLQILNKLLIELFFDNNSFIPNIKSNPIRFSFTINPNKINFSKFTDTYCSQFNLNESTCNFEPNNNLSKSITEFINSNTLSGGTRLQQEIPFINIYSELYNNRLTCELSELLELIIKINIYKNYFYQSVFDYHQTCKFILKYNFTIFVQEQMKFYIDILYHYLHNNFIDHNWYSFILLYNYFICIYSRNKNLENNNNYLLILLLIKKDYLDNYYFQYMFPSLLINPQFLKIRKKLTNYLGYNIGLLLFKIKSITLFIYNINLNSDFDILFGTETCNGLIQNILQEITTTFYYSIVEPDNNTIIPETNFNNFYQLKQIILEKLQQYSFIVIKITEIQSGSKVFTIVLFNTSRPEINFFSLEELLQKNTILTGGSTSKIKGTNTTPRPTKPRPTTPTTPSTTKPRPTTPTTPSTPSTTKPKTTTSSTARPTTPQTTTPSETKILLQSEEKETINLQLISSLNILLFVEH